MFVFGVVGFWFTLMTWNAADEGSHPILKLVFDILSVWLGLMNVFDCLAYRNFLKDEAAAGPEEDALEESQSDPSVQP